MKEFPGENFMLDSDAARELYYDHAANLPIIDYHCHLPPREIAENRKFENLTRIWLDGDHYKWRAMRANGIDEHFITGKATDEEKFLKWAETVPFTLRNPLFHWTHLELNRVFGIKEILDASSASRIFSACSSMLQRDEFTTQNILRKFKVEVVCTTDDPADSLQYHQQLRSDGFEIKVLPAFRPDKAMMADDVAAYNDYLDKLGIAGNKEITGYSSLLDVLKNRHDYFGKMGCRLSDHGLEMLYASDYTETEVAGIFKKIREGKQAGSEELLKFKSAMLIFFAELDHDSNWCQQFHLGALRNNNSRMRRSIGPDTGFDSIGDIEMGRSLSRFLDKLDSSNKLAKTILYNLNPANNYLFASMTGNFNDGSFPGKMQFGSGWWFLDQREGIEWQINALSSLGLLSRFVGMLTDSRCFLSYIRHEYFRRILCNLIGNDIEKGLIPREMKFAGKMIENICYFNAKEYFSF
jgi:glucuronate isomerase